MSQMRSPGQARRVDGNTTRGYRPGPTFLRFRFPLGWNELLNPRPSPTAGAGPSLPRSVWTAPSPRCDRAVPDAMTPQHNG